MNSEKVKDIKKALKCCGMYKYDCEKCPYKSKGDDDDLTVNNGCGDLLLKDCTTLINELESELEKEQINNLNCDTELQYKEKRIAELEEYIKGNEQDAKAFVNGWHKDLETELKQFATLLKVKNVLTPSGWCVNIEDIDETLKEFINKGDEER